MPDIEDLSPEEQYKVYWLSQHLFEEGIEGIHFTEKMLEYLEGPAVEHDIELWANSELRGKRF